jgi:hypothetical protein
MDFNVFVPQPWLPRDEACVIITTRSVNEDTVTETFVIRKGKQLRLMSHKCRSANLNMIDLDEYARDWALTQLDGDLTEWWQSKQFNGFPYPPAPELRDVKPTFLVRAWLHNGIKDSLREVVKKTRSQDLISYLNLVQNLPPIAEDPV